MITMVVVVLGTIGVAVPMALTVGWLVGVFEIDDDFDVDPDDLPAI